MGIMLYDDLDAKILCAFPASAPTGESNNLQPAQQDVKFAPEAILPKTEANHETV